jgi:SAM-dependent methyltransferase
VVGIEPSPFARREVESKGIKVYEGTAESLPNFIQEAPFDVVVMSHVLEHCLDLRLTISNALELLRTGGHLVMEVPNCSSFQYETRGPAWSHFDVGRHVNYFTPGALQRLIGGHSTGVEVVRYYYRKYVEHFLPATLDHETRLWDRAYREEVGHNLAGVLRPSKSQSWMSLVRSFALKQERKYEAVGIVVRKK